MREVLIRKLTSRKLWMSVASFVSMLLIACGNTESEAAQVAALIMAGATVIGYCVGEGLSDSKTVVEPIESTVVTEEEE